MQVYDTADEARGFAEEALEYARERAGEGWPEDTGSICWGRVLGSVTQTTDLTLAQAEEAGDEDAIRFLTEHPEVDVLWDFELRDEEITP